MGLSLSVTCAAESLVFYFLPHILRLGMRRCMHLVLAAFLLRMGLYAALQYAPSPWMVSGGPYGMRPVLGCCVACQAGLGCGMCSASGSGQSD